MTVPVFCETLAIQKNPPPFFREGLGEGFCNQGGIKFCGKACPSPTSSPEKRGGGLMPLVTTLVAAAAVLLGLTLPAPAVAVDFIEIVEKEVAKQNQNQHGFRIENFDQWVFSNQQKLSSAQKQLLDRLEGEAESIQSTCKLEDGQKEKLLLAGRGDIQAFTQLYAEVRAKFVEKINENNQQAIQNVWQEIQPLQKKYHGQIFGEGSLFEKVLGHLLDEQQSARLEKIRREQRKFQYQSAIMQTISQFDQVAPLTHKSREKLLALIKQHSYPPKAMTGHNRTHYLTYYIYGQMAEIPEDELRPLFGKAVWKVVKQQMQQGKRMKRNLEQQGLVPDKE